MEGDKVSCNSYAKAGKEAAEEREGLFFAACWGRAPFAVPGLGRGSWLAFVRSLGKAKPKSTLLPRGASFARNTSWVHASFPP